MVDARDAAQEAANKLMAKSSRWRTKIFNNTHSSGSHGESPPRAEIKPIKPVKSFKLDDDVNAFLKPSTEKAQQHRDNAAAHLATANRPRIDIASAKRWPGAQDILNSAAGNSPGPGGMRTGTRKKGLTVSFVRTVPDIIGHGGDECEEPASEVARRKNMNTLPAAGVPAQQPRDDAHLNTSIGRTQSQTEQRHSLTRTGTSHGEISPPLGQKLDMGHINSHAQPPPTPPLRMGPMGLGDRPKPLSRAPTGFDVVQTAPPGRRPSDSSGYSQDSDNMSPVLGRKISNVEPTIQEEEDFRPRPMQRTQTGFQEAQLAREDAPAMPTVPRLPEMDIVQREDESPLSSQAMLVDRYLQSEPQEPDSFSARVKQRMRSEEGKALHEAAQRNMMRRDSDSSSMQSVEQAQSGASPSSIQGGFAPSRTLSHGHGGALQQPSSLRNLDAADPQRSRARGPSPGRAPLPPGSSNLNTDVPAPGYSQYTAPYPATYTHTSPAIPPEPTFEKHAPAQQMPPARDQVPPSAISQSSILTTPPQFEQGASYQAFNPAAAAPNSPPDPRGNQLPVRTRSVVSEKPAAPLARSDTKTLGELALKDFLDRVTHMRGIFQLTAQLGGNLYDRTPTQWLRVATWWFLRGRAGMESMIRSRPKSAESQPERLTQSHVDLAKVAWIVTEIVPNHPALQRYAGQTADAQAEGARQAGDSVSAEAFEIQSAIFHYMKLLMGSMKKHQSMPPTQALIQGQDQSIWEQYPPFAMDAASVLQAGIPAPAAAPNGSPRPATGLSQLIPLADTKGEFCYFRMFVKASLSTDDPNTDRVPMHAVVSVLRPKDQYRVKLAICSQTDIINIIVDSDRDGGPSWNEITWRKQSFQISVQLRHGFNLNIELNEGDFRSLWAIVDHTNRVQTDLRERKDERIACKLQLREASYKDPANPSAFPPERVYGSKLTVFEKIELSSEGTGKRKLHRGYRMVLVTSPQNKQVSLVKHEVGSKQAPLNFEYCTEADQAPAMRLHLLEEAPEKKPRMCSVHMVFQDSKDRNHLFGTFTSMNLAQGEMTFAQVPLKSFHIESADQAEGFSQKGSRVLEKLQWLEAKVVNQDPEAAGLEAAPTVMSESLRIVCRHSAGIISDRMNLGPGELLVRLPIDGAPELTLLREAQQDLSVAIDTSRSEKDTPDALNDLLKTLTTASTIRRLTFSSFKDLHAFQFAVTGFDVKFDGIASTFSISRRRMVVPIYKQWTANTIRLQIVEQDNIVQLLAFFEEFSHADAMNFQLRTMDTYEKTDKGGKFGLKLVDAKFALPVEERRGEGKMQKEEGRLTGWAGVKRKFVCLDEIEYPGEHDDILIQFDSAETRDVFAAALPAATMERKFTVRRKI